MRDEPAELRALVERRTTVARRIGGAASAVIAIGFLAPGAGIRAVSRHGFCP